MFCDIIHYVRFGVSPRNIILICGLRNISIPSLGFFVGDTEYKNDLKQTCTYCYVINGHELLNCELFCLKYIESQPSPVNKWNVKLALCKTE